jgi:hypothetical protein
MKPNHAVDITKYTQNLRKTLATDMWKTDETLETKACNMGFFLSRCLRPIPGDIVPTGNNLLLVAWCTPWPRRASAEWGHDRECPQRRAGVGQRGEGWPRR